MAAIAVFMMMAVACAPVFAVIAEDKGTDAAAGKVISGSDIQIFKEDSADFSNLVYFGTDLPKGYTVDTNFVPIKDDKSANTGYWVHKTLGTLLKIKDIPGYSPEMGVYGFPMIQFTYGYSDASINNIDISYEVRYGTTVLTSVDAVKEPGKAHIGNDKQINDGAAGYVKHEGVKTISLTTNEDLVDRLWIAPAMQVGDFTLTAKLTQGITTQTVTKTVTAGPAVTVSGKVMDANGNPISGATVTPTINGSPVAAVDTVNGSYSFNVVKGSVVSVAASYIADAYKFAVPSYSFGTVSSSVSHDFKANEKTGTITVNDAGNTVVKKGDTAATVVWYKEVKKVVGTAAPTYSVSPFTEGIVKVVKTLEGKTYFSYVVPQAIPVDTTTTPGTTVTTTFYLIANGTDNTGFYTFDLCGVGGTPASDKAVDVSMKGHTGSADAKNGSAIVIAKEKTGMVTVQSANGNPAQTTTLPTVTWYKEVTTIVASPSSTTYAVAADSTGGSVSTCFGMENGKAYFTYKAPTPIDPETTPGKTVTTAFYLIANGTNGDIYTFDSTGTPAADKSVNESLKGHAGSADAKNGTAVLTSKEKTYKISGNVEGKITGNVTYTVDAGANTDAPIGKDGSYSFFVKENAVVTIKAIPGYTPVADYALGTITKDTVANFTKTVAPVVKDEVKYVVKGLATGDIATFSFTLNGVKMTDSVVAVADGASSFKAVLVLSLKVTDSVTDVSAKVDGKNISAFNGYVANASMPDKTYTMITQIKVPTATEKDPTATTPKNVPFTVSYTYGNGVTGTLTTDANGIGKLTLPANIVPDTVDITFSSGIYKIEAKLVTGDPYVGTVCTLNVSDAYAAPAGKYLVNVDHVSTIAQGNVTEPGSNPIGGGEVLMNVGDKVSLYAPEYNGYTFKCWMLNGTSIGTDRTIDFTLTQKVLDASDKTVGQDEVYLQAVYSATPVFAPSAGIDNMTLIIGIIAVVIALLAVVYTVISLKKE